MDIDDKITIIEGPPPTFEAVSEDWVQGLNEGANLGEIALTRLRTFSGSALVERCHKAWRHNHPIYLEFRTNDGLEQQAPIVAARALATDDGDVLLLWVRMNADEVEIHLEYSDDEEDDDSTIDDDNGDDDDDVSFLDLDDQGPARPLF